MVCATRTRPIPKDVLQSFRPTSRQLRKYGVAPEAIKVHFYRGKPGRYKTGYGRTEFTFLPEGKEMMAEFLLNGHYRHVCTQDDKGNWTHILVELFGDNSRKNRELCPATISHSYEKVHIQLLDEDNTIVFTAMPKPIEEPKAEPEKVNHLANIPVASPSELAPAERFRATIVKPEEKAALHKVIQPQEWYTPDTHASREGVAKFLKRYGKPAVKTEESTAVAVVPVAAVPVGHTCSTSYKDEELGEVELAIEEEDGFFVLAIGREVSKVNFCPICGARAPKLV